VAEHYDGLANTLNEKENFCPAEYKLSPLPINSVQGKNYWAEMEFCLQFAKNNRQLMSDRIREIFFKNLGINEVSSEIEIHHNFAALENHLGHDVVIHRKGATRAFEGMTGIIPGSQGTASYIVEGLGNPESFKSCSHGAGRVLSRTAAVRTLNLEEEIKKLDDQGIVHAIRNKGDLEEASSAYKNIDEVMEQQKDLVRIVYRLSPLAVIKG